MRVLKATALLALAASVLGFPQGADPANFPTASAVSAPIGESAQFVSSNPTGLSQSVAAEISSLYPPQERSIAYSPCVELPQGSGDTPKPDTPAVFQSYSVFAQVARSAPIPPGYRQTFGNLQASCNAQGYLGYASMRSYNPTMCAAFCNKTLGCQSFNIYYERDPTLNPGPGCLNPASTTFIKCVLWAGQVNAANAVNTGQWRANFQVVIAGSNGYWTGK
ncbi:uncharacterized protein BDR25DRAFT_304752 [Lindgomyces ingoldianus]|uniref:Uncharacterized protein n=1 Tax=Lindgomyces ingoldianus TaxID=673940 RepID=A0ACB6QP69_9PLEO|nr:uncharacterized protein BDR25DRAFT_304752 [Lindgomyces ingoldianus]KAF2468768.1 hypothetical protein BDR25DRAFT_304752 [Lindgomyces ingoldianus]